MLRVVRLAPIPLDLRGADALALAWFDVTLVSLFLSLPLPLSPFLSLSLSLSLSGVGCRYRFACADGVWPSHGASEHWAKAEPPFHLPGKRPGHSDGEVSQGGSHAPCVISAFFFTFPPVPLSVSP